MIERSNSHYSKLIVAVLLVRRNHSYSVFSSIITQKGNHQIWKGTMHREEIKAGLRLTGSSLACVARELGVTKQTVNAVLSGKRRSKRIEEMIAQKLGLSVVEVWPERYPSPVKQFALF